MSRGFALLLCAALLAPGFGTAWAGPAEDDYDFDHDYHDEHDVWSSGNFEEIHEVERGQRLEAHSFNGDIRVTVGRADRVVIKAETSGGTELSVRRRGKTLQVQGVGRHGPANLELSIVAPSWMPLELNGVNTDVLVRGFESEIAVVTVNGDVIVEGGRGRIDLSSVNGEVISRGARGRIRARSVNDDVSVVRSSGTVRAESVDGDVVLRAVHADTLIATTVEGDVVFEGEIRPRGSYRFESHDGDVVVILPSGTDARVTVGSYDGDVGSDFPEGRRPRGRRHEDEGFRYSFTLGSGSARIEISSFDGDIAIRRGNSGGSDRSRRDARRR